MDDIGVSSAASGAASKISNGGKAMGGYIYTKSSAASSAVNEKIDNNDTLSSAKTVTKEKIG